MSDLLPREAAVPHGHLEVSGPQGTGAQLELRDGLNLRLQLLELWLCPSRGSKPAWGPWPQRG